MHGHAGSVPDIYKPKPSYPKRLVAYNQSLALCNVNASYVCNPCTTANRDPDVQTPHTNSAQKLIPQSVEVQQNKQYILDTTDQSMENYQSPLHSANQLMAVQQGEAISSSKATQTGSWNSGMCSTLLLTDWNLYPGQCAILPFTFFHKLQCPCGMKNMNASRGQPFYRDAPPRTDSNLE